MTKRIPYLAAAWSFASAALALVWTVIGHGFPYGRTNADPYHPLHALAPAVGAPLFAAVLLAAGVAALAAAGPWTRSAPALRAVGWLAAAGLMIFVPGLDALALAGYAPALLIGAPFGWPGNLDYAEVFNVARVFGLWAVLGGLLLGATMFGWRRDTGPRPVPRWGRWVAYVAAACPLVYAVSRLAWVVGIPLGISRAMLDDLWANGGVWAAAGLGGFALVGSVLTLGLVQRWGETFPRWMPGLGGRRVPITLAVAPASFVAIAVAGASAGFLATGRSVDLFRAEPAAVFPMLFWPLWSITLFAATYAYYVRRRAQAGTGAGESASASRIASSASVAVSPNTADV